MRLAHRSLRAEGRHPAARIWVENVSGNFFRVRSSLSIHNLLSVPMEIKLVHLRNNVKRESTHVLAPCDPDSPDLPLDKSRYYFTIGDLVENYKLYFRPLAAAGEKRCVCVCVYVCMHVGFINVWCRTCDKFLVTSIVTPDD